MDGIKSLRVHCPAKLNLFLQILSRRDDGFHELETLMAPINLFDTLEFRARPDEKITLDCRPAHGLTAQFFDQPSNLPAEQDNLAWRAVRQLQQKSGVSCGADLTLIKRIPAAAGLGGASSNAAWALLAAHRAWGLHWPLEQLEEFGGRLGSDVPLFIRGAAAIGRGRGEQLTSVRLPRLHFVLLKPAEGLSTPEVYRNIELGECGRAKVTATRVVELFCRGEFGQAEEAMTNDLEAPARRLSGCIEEAFQRLAHQGLTPRMSGSGSCCFAWTATRQSARRVAAALRSQGGTAFPVETLAQTS